jgi:release factor glutamine methyltransferase
VLELALGKSTIADALGDAAQRLAGPEIADPRREARALWAAVAGGGLRPGDVWLARERPAAAAIRRRFWEAVERRASGVPFAYAVGRASFRTLELKCDPRALIPRPETEGLVELVLRAIRETGNGRRESWGAVADIGTGCGCIALALAIEGRFEQVVAVDRSGDAAALARENVALVRPPVPVEVRVGDLLAPLAGQRCRAIVSNPPYLTEAEYAALDPAVRRFEPREALVSGRDGLAATDALFAGARPLLEPGGVMVVEVDDRRALAVRDLARRHGWTAVTVHNDLFGRPRFVSARLEEGA